MANVEAVVLAFVALGKTAEAVDLTQRAEFRLAAGDQLVSVGLMPDVPYDAVAWSIKGSMQGEGQLNDAEVAGEMPSVFGDRLDNKPSDLLCQGRELLFGELAQIGW